MKTKASPPKGPQRFVLVFSSDDSEERRAAITALKTKMQTLAPEPAISVGTDVFQGYWILTLRTGQKIEDLGDTIDPFFCQTVAEFEAALVGDEGDGLGG